jgi:hypothetical protein
VFTSEIFSCICAAPGDGIGEDTEPLGEVDLQASEDAANAQGTHAACRLVYPDLVILPDPAGSGALLRVIVGRLRCARG